MKKKRREGDKLSIVRCMSHIILIRSTYHLLKGAHYHSGNDEDFENHESTKMYDGRLKANCARMTMMKRAAATH